MGSRFVRARTYSGPDHWFAPPFERRGLQGKSRFMREVAVMPLAWQVDAPLMRPIPQGATPRAAAHVCHFLARVTDLLGEDGDELLALQLWQAPSWRPLEASLSLKSLEERDWVGKERPLPGDQLWIWTWMEALPGEVPRPRICVQVERRQLTQAEREEAEALRLYFEGVLESLQRDGQTSDEEEG